MNDDEKRIIELTVENAVQKGVTAATEPLWEKVRDHDTAIALNQEQLTQGIGGQVAQGTRIGDLETEVVRINTHKKWIVAIFALFKAAILGILGWILTTKS